MRRICMTVLFLLTLSTLIFGAISCKSEEDSIRDYADPATEAMLKGMSDSDYDQYIEHANDAFKAALTEEMFDLSAAQINSQLGAFKSIEYTSYEDQEGLVIVHYTAKYEKMEVGIRMVFDSDKLIAGQWFE